MSSGFIACSVSLALLLCLFSIVHCSDDVLITQDGSVGLGDGKFAKPLEPVDFRSVSYGASSPFDKYKVIKIIPRHKQHVKLLSNFMKPAMASRFKVSFWKEPQRANLPVFMMVSPITYPLLKRWLMTYGMQHKIMCHDVGKQMESENHYHSQTAFSRATGYDYGRYHQFHQIIAQMKSLISRYPRMAKLVYFGKSYEGKSLEGIKISAKQGTGRKMFFLNCGIHAREWVSPATCIYLIETMLRTYGKDSTITSMLNRMDWVILPVLNADGYAHTWKSKANRFWRKTRSPQGRCTGVDPNRNFGWKWGGKGASNNPCTDIYHGKKPFSEIEVLSMVRYLYKNRKQLVGFADIHSFGQYWLVPYGYDTVVAKDATEQDRVAKEAVKAIRNMTPGNTYKEGPSSVLLSPAAGGSDDWAYGYLDVKYSYTIELRDKGKYGFDLPASQIIPTAKECLQGLKAVAKTMQL